MRRVVFVLCFLSLIYLLCFGCATGDQKYTRPTLTEPITNTITVKKNKAQVWKELIPQIRKNFFVINNLDEESGIINISYSGDPQKYVDCGEIYSHMKNARGERTYRFPASKGYQGYEGIENGNYFFVNRKMELEARMNLVIEEVGTNTTQITANTRYVLTKTIDAFDARNRHAGYLIESISFNTGQQKSYPGGTVCQSNGNFEREILYLIK